MILPRIEERTLYPPIISYLQELGFEAIGETRVARKQPDILFSLDKVSFVIEIKIGRPDIGLKAVAQAHDYAKKLGTQNIIILIYPEEYRDQAIFDESIVTRVALEKEISALVLTDYWTESLVIKPIELFKSLKDKIISKKVKVEFNTVVELIKSYVKDLSDIIYQIEMDELVSEVVNKLDLFSSIGEIKDEEAAKRQVKILASYLLFNQLLFYHIFKRKTKDERLPELEKIESVKELQNYFDQITNINYRSIYKINILGHVPNKEAVINTLNELIEAIKLLRAEHITHDLSGRFFHDLIPSEVRKILAAFYTHPIAAEILAGLTINSWNEKVIDPACGSGTLLVSAYKRKQKLYQELYGYTDFNEMHRRFIEEDLTGIDIMPFAAHLTTINLSTQNIEQETNVVRISTKDSLKLIEGLIRKEFKDKGIKVSPYTATIQETFLGASSQKESEGAISPEGRGEEFYLEPVDVVIMNPPFTDREKMPEDMRKELENNRLGKTCGHQVNLWGYFLALCDYLLKPGGRIGVVIPINIFRGGATEKIRKHLVENYKIEYVVKAGKNVAFSENAKFRDVLLIAKKKRPSDKGKVRFVILNEDIHELAYQEVGKIVKHIKGEPVIPDKDLDIIDYEYNSLKENIDNLMLLFGPASTKSAQILSNFLSTTQKYAGQLLRKLNGSEIVEGFHSSPRGLSQMAFITNPLKENRIRNAFLILKREDDDFAEFYIKDYPDKTFKIEKSKLAPALRTVTDINKFDILNVDYIITDKFKGWKTVLKFSKFKDKENFTYDIIKRKMKKACMVIARRFRPNSKNTYFFAFCSDKKFIGSDAFKYILLKDFVAKINTLFLNSVLGIINLTLLRGQTTEGYTDMRESDLILFDIIDVELLSEEQKKELLKLYDELKDCEFPSLLEQFKERFWARVELDKRLLQILGVPKREINIWLPKVYDTIVAELSQN
ncbi:MAG: N-6 DNA methylase [Thermoplasmatales archaeon]|nr:N-6 DNA methylase [Thermoplasmatales archaeon]